MESILHQFLHTHTHKKAETADGITHMFFGREGIIKLHIDESELADFYAIYLDYVKSVSFDTLLNGLNVLVERVPKNKLFNFFLDIDAPKDDDATDIVKHVTTFICDRSSVEPKDIAVSKRLLNKVHMVFPGLEVNTNQAKVIRDLIVDSFVSDEEERSIYDKIIDRSVYSSGLRMIFSHKGRMAKMDSESSTNPNQLYIPEGVKSIEDMTEDMFNRHSILWKHDTIKTFDPEFQTQVDTTKETARRGTVRRYALVPQKRDRSVEEEVQIHLTESEVEMLDYYMKHVFKLEGVSFEYTKIRCLQDPIAIEVTLVNQKCPFTKTDDEAARCHIRTATRNVPSNYILITEKGVYFKCWNGECSGKSIKLCDSEFIFDGFFSRNDEWYYLKKSLSLTHETVGNFVFHHYAKHNYRVVRAGKSYTWYKWTGYRWMDADHLATEIMDEYGPIQSQYMAWWAMQLAQNSSPLAQAEDDASERSDEETDKKESRGHKVIAKVMKLLQTRTFVEHIKQTVGAKLMQFDPSFESKLDQEPFLICFENGVMDFRHHSKGKKMEIRAGQPSDCCSISTGNNYYSWEAIPESTKTELNKFLEEIFPTETVREHALWILASCLNGNIKKQKFYFFIGSGANGKSSLMKLLSLGLGPYSVDVSVSLVTKERTQSSAPSPDLITLKHAKWITMSEPDAGDSIRVGILKQLSSSNDKITGRQLYGAPQSFYVYGTIAMLANEIPQISATSPNDFGSWRRLEVIPFESTFTERPDPKKRNHFKVDFSIDSKLDSWKYAFMALLVTKLEKYGTEGPEVPEKVEELTKNLRWRSNYVGRFVEELVDQSSTDEFTSLKTLFREYASYAKYTLQISDKQRGSVESIRQQFIAILGEVRKNDRKEEGFHVKIKSVV